VKVNGKPATIKRFNYGKDDDNADNNVPMTCTEGPASTFLEGFLPAMEVKQRAFGGTFGLDTDGNELTAEAHVNVAGEFKHHNKLVVGTIRVHGDFAGDDLHNCDTTKLGWAENL
jgi:hypothetical protein